MSTEEFERVMSIIDLLNDTQRNLLIEAIANKRVVKSEIVDAEEMRFIQSLFKE